MQTEGLDYSDAVIAAKDAEIAKLKSEVRVLNAALDKSTAEKFTQTFCGFPTTDWLDLCHRLGGPKQIDYELARLRAIKSAAEAWADWQEKFDAMDTTFYAVYPKRTNAVYEELRSHSATLIKAVKP